jgi:hypothetical protein
MAWMPVIQVETAKEVRQAAASIDSLRNTNHKNMAEVAASVLQVAERMVPTREVRPLGLVQRLLGRKS